MNIAEYLEKDVDERLKQISVSRADFLRVPKIIIRDNSEWAVEIFKNYLGYVVFASSDLKKKLESVVLHFNWQRCTESPDGV